MQEFAKINNKPLNYSDFIPIEIHYNEKTLLTKNGELIQIIRIDDAGDIDDKEYQCMRETIRRNLKACFDHNFYLYIYTVRTRKDVYPKSKIDHKYADEIYKLWGEKNNWHNQLTNTLYIAIVLPAVKYSAFSIRGFSKLWLQNYVDKNLAKKYAKLHFAVENFNNNIEKLKPTTLTCLNKGDKVISEPLSFIYYLTHLEEKECEPPEEALSTFLADFNMKYSLNTFEINNKSAKQFGLILTFKDVQDMSIENFDKLLNIGSNVIITEFVRFVPANIIKNYFAPIHDECNTFTEEDEDYRIFNRMMTADEKNTNDYYQKQLTYLLYTDRFDFFDNKAKNLMTEINNLGINAIREDFALPTVFWSRVPGNFRYIKRPRYDYTKKIAIFSSIHPSSIKYLKGSIWGDPLTILRTHEGFPYFFNFHVEQNGNTLLLSNSPNFRNDKLYFLLLLAQKFLPKIVIIDFEESNSGFLNRLQAVNMNFAQGEDLPIQFDLFNEKNFLNEKTLVKETIINLFEDKKVEEMLEEVLQYPPDARFEKFHELITTSIKSKHLEVFESFFSADEFRFCFSSDVQDILDDDLIFEESSFVNINLSALNKDSIVIKLYATLLLLRLIRCVKNKPSIIVMKKFSSVIGDKITLNIINKALKAAEENNTAIILCDDYQDIAPHLKNLAKIQDLFATQLYTTTIEISNQWKKILKLSESDFYNLRVYKPESGKALLIQSNTSTVVEIDTRKLNNDAIK